MLGHRQLNMEDYLAILRRRLWVILLGAVLGGVGAYLYSRQLPDLFTSRTLVMMTGTVAEGFVKPIGAQEFEQRLGTMREQILSRSRLELVIEHLGLFKEDVGKVPMEALVQRLRPSIEIRPVRSDIESGNSVLPGFHIGFTAKDPRLAQQICTEIVSLFMKESLHFRQVLTLNTRDFLQDELQEAKSRLDEQDARLAGFKRQYLGQLPDQEQANLSILAGLNTQLSGVTQDLNRAYQDKAHAESLLAQETTAWELSKAGTNPLTLEQQLANLQSQLVTLEGRYTRLHPDVVKMKHDIEQLKRKIAEAPVGAKDQGAPENTQKTALSEPPVIQRMRHEIYSYQRTIETKTQDKQKLEEKIQQYQARVQMSPLIEQKYKDVMRDYQSALTLYNDLRTKKGQAEMATNLQQRQESEQFRIVDPPNLPQSPSYPDRQTFAAGGLGGGLAFGLGIALLLELRDKSIRTEQDVELFLHLPTLSLVPFISGSGKKGFWEHANNEPVRIVPRVKV
jgi:polysaccharide chain length determinant protein (PEP-CTERM system associated)